MDCGLKTTEDRSRLEVGSPKLEEDDRCPTWVSDARNCGQWTVDCGLEKTEDRSRLEVGSPKLEEDDRYPMWVSDARSCGQWTVDCGLKIRINDGLGHVKK